MIYNSEFIIDTKRLLENVTRIKENISPNTKLIPMLKGDAYGHGLLKVAELIEDEIEFVGVAHVLEGVRLRENGFKKRIIVFAGITKDQVETVVKYHLEPIIHNHQSISFFEKALKEKEMERYPVHLKINTGLNRLGFNLDELERVGKLLQDKPEFKIVSTYSHFIEGYKPQSNTTVKQFNTFKKGLDILKETGLNPGFIHICDSGSYEWFKEGHLDAVRIGRALYMDNPLYNESERFKDIGSWHATLIESRHIKKGEVIGYDVNCIAKEDMHLGIINIGYADGLISDLKDVGASVLINGQKAPIVSIAMDQTYINLNNIKSHQGDIVTIIGEDDKGNYLSSNEGMKLLDDEGCTLTTFLSNRVKRTYR